MLIAPLMNTLNPCALFLSMGRNDSPIHPPAQSKTSKSIFQQALDVTPASFGYNTHSTTHQLMHSRESPRCCADHLWVTAASSTVPLWIRHNLRERQVWGETDKREILLWLKKNKNVYACSTRIHSEVVAKMGFLHSVRNSTVENRVRLNECNRSFSSCLKSLQQTTNVPRRSVPLNVAYFLHNMWVCNDTRITRIRVVLDQGWQTQLELKFSVGQSNWNM